MLQRLNSLTLHVSPLNFLLPGVLGWANPNLLYLHIPSSRHNLGLDYISQICFELRPRHYTQGSLPPNRSSLGTPNPWLGFAPGTENFAPNPGQSREHKPTSKVHL